MAAINFSYKEALAHGWAMTKKHLGIVLVLAIISTTFHFLSGLISGYAGKGFMSQSDVILVFKDATQSKKLYQHFQKVGYISSIGQVKNPLQIVSSPSEVNLPPEFENQRRKIFDFLNAYRYQLPFPKPIYYALTVILWLGGALISIGLVKISIMLSRDETPSVWELFTNIHLLIPYLLGGLCYGAAIVGGFILFIIPGLIFMIMFQLYLYLIVDQGLGPIESLKRSRVLTKGSRMRLAGFAFIALLVNIGGALCLVVGLLLTIPATSIASAYVYDQFLKSQPQA